MCVVVFGEVTELNCSLRCGYGADLQSRELLRTGAGTRALREQAGEQARFQSI